MIFKNNTITFLTAIATLIFASMPLAFADEQNENFISGYISHEDKICPAAGCRVVCISYQNGKVLLEKQFRSLTVTQFANSDIRMQGMNGVVEVELYMNTRRAICHISS